MKSKCQCTHNFTCRHCCDNAKPWLFTPSNYQYYWSQQIAKANKEEQRG